MQIGRAVGNPFIGMERWFTAVNHPGARRMNGEWLCCVVSLYHIYNIRGPDLSTITAEITHGVPESTSKGANKWKLVMLELSEWEKSPIQSTWYSDLLVYRTKNCRWPQHMSTGSVSICPLLLKTVSQRATRKIRGKYISVVLLERNKYALTNRSSLSRCEW